MDLKIPLSNRDVTIVYICIPTDATKSDTQATPIDWLLCCVDSFNCLACLLWDLQTNPIPPYAAFRLEVVYSVQPAKVRHGLRAKSGCDPNWAVLVSQYYCVVVLRCLKGSRQVWATHAVRRLVDRIVPSVWQGITNKHSSHKVFLDNGKSFVYWNVTQKFAVLLGRCCFIIVRAVLFPWDAMRSRCLRSCRGYRCPTPSYHKCIGGGGNASRNWAGLYRTLTTELRRAGAEAYLPVEMHH